MTGVQNSILVLGLALVLANGLASGEIKDLWHVVTSAKAPNSGQDPMDSGVNGVITNPNGTISPGIHPAILN